MIYSKAGIGQQRWKCNKEMQSDDMSSEIDAIRRLENGDSKAKIGWDQNLHEAMAQTALKKSDEYESKLTSFNIL